MNCDNLFYFNAHVKRNPAECSQNAALDKAIAEDQITKVNGGSALAVALLIIFR